MMKKILKKTNRKKTLKQTKAALLKAPKAIKKPSEFSNHGDKRRDDYFWMKDVKDPDTLKYIKEENSYSEKVLAPLKGLSEKLFKEMKSRVKENDSSAPTPYGDYLYYSKVKKGKQYSIHCRKKKKGGKEEILLDCNALAKGKKYFGLGTNKISPDHSLLAFGVDYTGDEIYTIHFKDLKTGKVLKDKIINAHGSLEWANDSQTVFYSELDNNHRPHQVKRYKLGSLTEATVIYKETDSQHFVSPGKTADDAYLLIESGGKVTSETWFVSADEPNLELTCVQPRIEGHEYSVEHRKGLFYILSNFKAINFKVMVTPVHQHEMKFWQEWISESKDSLIQSLLIFENHLVLSEFSNALPKVRIYNFINEKFSTLVFKEKAFALGFSQGNFEFNSKVVRMSIDSPITPTTVFDYDMNSGKRKIIKVDTVKGFKTSNYKCDRIFVKAHDGKGIPMTVVYKKGFKKNGKNPFLLYGYGSYGAIISPRFNRTILSLLNRGFGYAIAHIRGGQELGRPWYEDGKFLNKKNTFLDFISCSDFLVKNKWTNPNKLAIKGGSAGGMLMGAVINMRPELYQACVAHVPFVDVINTMFDDGLPLTTIEYKEWGNPNEKKFYDYMKSYSPYDNIQAQRYPHLLITGGLHDHRVTYWEPTKWAAKLREYKTDDNILLLKIKMSAGHFGASGRFEWLKEEAEADAFLIKYLNEPLK